MAAPLVGILMGSTSDLEVMKQAAKVLDEFGVAYEADVVSALVNLGYDARTAESAVGEAKRQAGTTHFEKLLRATLQALSAPKGRANRAEA